MSGLILVLLFFSGFVFNSIVYCVGALMPRVHKLLQIPISLFFLRYFLDIGIMQQLLDSTKLLTIPKIAKSQASILLLFLLLLLSQVFSELYYSPTTARFHKLPQRPQNPKSSGFISSSCSSSPGLF